MERGARHGKDDTDSGKSKRAAWCTAIQSIVKVELRRKRFGLGNYRLTQLQ